MPSFAYRTGIQVLKIKSEVWRDGQKYLLVDDLETPADALNIPYLKARGACEIHEVDQPGHEGYWIVRSKFNHALAVIYKEYP